MADSAAPARLLPGLREALRVVDAEADRLRTRGLSSIHFFFGLITCVATAFLYGHMPESVWLVYACEALVILGYRLFVDYTTHNEPRTMYYFFDFCWVVNFACAGLAFVILFQVLDDAFFGDLLPTLDIASQYPDLGRIVCLVATGPLGWSVIVLKNALVLHDIQLYSGCFIHLWPAITTLSVRRYPDVVMATYPGHFDSLTGFHDPPAGASVLHLWKLGAVAYFAWWLPFTLWMLVHGRFQSPKITNADTVYFNLVNTNGAVRKVLGIPKRPLDGQGSKDWHTKVAAISPVMKYMVLHAVLTMLSFLWSSLCYKWLNMHIGFALLLISTALFNTSSWYHWNLTRRYSRAVQKAIKRVESAEKATKFE